MKITEAEGRELFIDDAKGFAAILVIVAHLLGSVDIPGIGKTLLGMFCYFTHVPCFLLISGFLLCSSVKKHGTSCIKERIVKWGLVGIEWWILLSLVYILISFFLKTPDNATWVESMRYAFLCVWFFWVLTTGYLMVFMTEKAKEIRGGGHMFVLALIAVFVVVCFCCRPVAKLIGHGLIVLEGYWLGKTKINIKIAIVSVLSFLLLFFLCVPRGYLSEINDAATGVYQLALLSFKMISAFFLVSLFFLLTRFINCFRAIAYIGKHSLEYYLLHLVPLCIYRSFHSVTLPQSFVWFIAILVGVGIITYLCDRHKCIKRIFFDPLDAIKSMR